MITPTSPPTKSAASKDKAHSMRSRTTSVNTIPRRKAAPLSFFNRSLTGTFRFKTSRLRECAHWEEREKGNAVGSPTGRSTPQEDASV